MDFSHVNIIILTFIAVTAIISIYFVFKKELEPAEEDIERDSFSIPFLKEGIKITINEIVDQNIFELYLNKSETKKREQQKARVSKSVRTCAQGNIGEREFMKDYIRNLLQDNFGVNEATVDQIIPFGQPKALSPQDKFEILYAQMNSTSRYRTFAEINNVCMFDNEKTNEYGSYYEVTDSDIEEAFEILYRPLRYVDRLEVVTQRIYQELYGLSTADILRYDTTIDGISGGCSGASTEQYNYMEETYETGGTKKAKTYHSLWVFFRGKAMHLSFLSFNSQNDLIRTCKNLYRYGTVGHLTSKTGYKLTYQADGSRVVVVRPNLSTHWAFFLRKFDSTKNRTIDKLIVGENNSAVVEMLKWIVKGCLNLIISGDQNSGKTTCLKALGIFFDRRDPVRTTEQEFELWLNNAYEGLNCVCFRGSEDVPIMDAIAIQKKMDASRMLLGEVNNFELAAAFISLCQSGTRSSICTCHCVNTEDAIDYFRNSVMGSGMFKTEMTAEEQVANSIHIDVHWEKTSDGRRYVSYINEIVPYPRENEENEGMTSLDSIADSLKLMSRKRAFFVRTLLVYENDAYVLKNNFSDRNAARILKNLSLKEKKEFLAFNRAG